MADFFDKLAGGISKGVASVGVSSKAMMDKAKINTIIGNLDNEYKQLAQSLGVKVYEMYKATGGIEVDNGMINFVTEMDKRLESIVEQREQLKRIDEEVSLVTGGAKPVSQGGTACSCGQIGPESAKFCVKCGNKL